MESAASAAGQQPVRSAVLRVPKRWVFPDTPDWEVDRLARDLRIAPAAARVLWNRGYRDPLQARTFLEPSLALLHDPFLMLGMDRAVQRLLEAIARKEQILLYGDYDVDGTSSVVILKKAIDLAGGSVRYHVPHRLKEGYGMRTEVLKEASEQGVSLVISVDTGIRAADVVRAATEWGVDLIITDHHLPDEDVPPALAVLNPNQPGCPYPEKNLCGAGVTFKLIQALLARLDWPETKRGKLLESFLKIVAIATVADVVPLLDENRIIVKTGLSGLDRVNNPGLRALLDVAGFSEGRAPSAGEVAFRVAPRINAAGRMANASDVIEMFLTTDANRARELASQLHDLNSDRQLTEGDILQEILAWCEENPVGPDQYALVFSKPGWHRGVIGIVASRVVERFHRPTFILGEEDGKAQGSGRSIKAFHLLEALEAMPELFQKFGGHRQAAGVTMDAAMVSDFRQRLNDWAAARLTPEDLQPLLEIDAEVNVPDISTETFSEIMRLAPFGFGNPAPVFAVRGAELIGDPDVIKEKHLRVRVRQQGRFFRAMGWNMADLAPQLRSGMRVDLAFTLENDDFSAGRGYDPWQAILKDIRIQ